MRFEINSFLFLPCPLLQTLGEFALQHLSMISGWVASRVGLAVYPSCSLLIYRWAGGGMPTKVNHPRKTPLVWQGSISGRLPYEVA